jgi:hypothetical protein
MPAHPLSVRFAAAGLSLDVLDEPLDRGRGTREVQIVQMDIARERAGERFRVFPGAGSNRLLVTTLDKRQKQVVMLVDEPRRRFEATVPRHQHVAPGTRILFEDRRKRVLELFTPPRKRHFLCGMDEAHLFIAQLPRAASTVFDAHRSLAPEIPNEYKNDPHWRRQGEWFFFPATPGDEVEIELHAKLVKKNAGIADAAGLRRAGRPHYADSVLVIGTRIFARGCVRHPDHAQLELRAWHRVLPNRETFEQPEGVLWFD